MTLPVKRLWPEAKALEMFTGLVQATGRLRLAPGGVLVHVDAASAAAAGPSGTTDAPAEPPLAGLRLGDSVAVDGVCLTVAELLPAGGGFRADISEETLHRTALAARAAAGATVNLEPALRLSDRLGGHLVSGHVDGLGSVRAIRRQAASWHLEVSWQDPTYGRYVCEKASVAIDGISLTVAGCRDEGVLFWIAVIPHTWTSTTLRQRRVGDPVNLEADLLAKYTERLLRVPGSGPATAASPGGPDGGLSRSWLAEQGW